MQHIVGLTGVKGSGKDTCARYLVEQQGYIRVGFADALYQEVAAAYAVTTDFIGNRHTKEQDLPALALTNCTNVEFVEIALGILTSQRRLRKAALAYLETGKIPPHASAREVTRVLKSFRSPRWTMQLWGTEYRRKSKYGVDSYWLDKVRSIIQEQPTKNFVVTDVRFKNEARFIETMGGLLCRVRRPILEEKEAKERAANGTAAHPSETEMLAYPVPVEIVNVEGDPDSLKHGIYDALQLDERRAA